MNKVYCICMYLGICTYIFFIYKSGPCAAQQIISQAKPYTELRPTHCRISMWASPNVWFEEIPVGKIRHTAARIYTAIFP